MTPTQRFGSGRAIGASPSACRMSIFCAIGLQDVDLLSVSQFLIDTAKRNIRGEITQAEVARLIEEYHSTGRTRKGIVAQKDAKDVSV